MRWLITVAVLIAGAAPASAQLVRCQFADVAVGLSGTCRRDGVEIPAGLSRRKLLWEFWPKTDVVTSIVAGPEEPGPWTGVFALDGWDLPFELIREMLGAEHSRLILRTALAWVLASEWQALAEGGAALTFTLADYPVASQIDVTILEVALERLASMTEWDRADDRNCENDPSGHVSLFCLLAAAVEEHMGAYHHRQPALEIMRVVIRERWADRLSGHPLMDFNNHVLTTQADLRAALRDAIDWSRAEALTLR